MILHSIAELLSLRARAAPSQRSLDIYKAEASKKALEHFKRQQIDAAKQVLGVAAVFSSWTGVFYLQRLFGLYVRYERTI